MLVVRQIHGARDHGRQVNGARRCPARWPSEAGRTVITGVLPTKRDAFDWVRLCHDRGLLALPPKEQASEIWSKPSEFTAVNFTVSQPADAASVQFAKTWVNFSLT
jgi:hypothetical protein